MSNKFYLLQRLGRVLIKITVFIAVIIAVKSLIHLFADLFVSSWIDNHSESSSDLAYATYTEIVLATSVFTAYMLIRFRQQKRVVAIKKQAWSVVVLRVGAGFTFAFIFGTLLVFAIYVLLTRLGYYHVISVNDKFPDDWQIFFLLLLSITEEVFARKYIQNIAEEKLGSGAALVVTTVVFSLIHLHNEGATSSLHTAVETLYMVGSISFFLSAAYLLTRQIWIPIALHWSIDFFLAAFTGNVWSNGAFNFLIGDYLPIQSTIFTLIGIITVVIAVRRGQWRNLPRPDQMAMTTETAPAACSSTT